MIGQRWPRRLCSRWRNKIYTELGAKAVTATSRPIRAYVLHGRVGPTLLDYADFFDWVGRLSRNQTRVQVNRELVLAIEKATNTADGGWHFRFVSGNPSEIPLVYIEATGETVEEPRPDGRWAATPNRVAVKPDRRLLAIELRRAGVGSINLERYFRGLAKQSGYSNRLSLDMNPLPSPSFSEELDQFERIREASIIVRRPNNDWDDADDLLSGLADDSAAHRAAITVNANRGESLARDRGIMRLIRQHVSRPLSNVDDVKVKGTQAGMQKERTVSLDRHQLQATAELTVGMGLSEEDATIFASAEELLARGSDIVAELEDLSPVERE